MIQFPVGAATSRVGCGSEYAGRVREFFPLDGGSIGMTGKDVQVQCSENGVRQAVLLDQKTRIAAWHTSRPTSSTTSAAFFYGSYLSMMAECLLIRPSTSSLVFEDLAVVGFSKPDRRIRSFHSS